MNRWTVTVTDLPPELGNAGTMVFDYIADDDDSAEDVERSVANLLPAACVPFADLDPGDVVAGATIEALAAP